MAGIDQSKYLGDGVVSDWITEDEICNLIDKHICRVYKISLEQVSSFFRILKISF